MAHRQKSQLNPPPCKENEENKNAEYFACCSTKTECYSHAVVVERIAVIRQKQQLSCITFVEWQRETRKGKQKRHRGMESECNRVSVWSGGGKEVTSTQAFNVTSDHIIYPFYASEKDK